MEFDEDPKRRRLDKEILSTLLDANRPLRVSEIARQSNLEFPLVYKRLVYLYGFKIAKPQRFTNLMMQRWYVTKEESKYLNELRKQEDATCSK